MKRIKLTSLLLTAILLFTPIKVNAANTDDIWDDIHAIEQQKNSIRKTEKMANKYKQIVELSDSSLRGKKITALGDSITDFGGWLEATQKISGCNTCNLGVGGAAIADYWDENSLILRWNQIPSDSDIIIIFAGINDFFIGDNFGSKGEAKTYCGDMWSLFNNIKNTYPNSDIFVVTTYRTQSENWEQFGGREAAPYMDIQREYANELGFKVIDVFSTGYLDSRDIKTKEKYVPDEVHTNEAGAELLAYNILAELTKYY